MESGYSTSEEMKHASVIKKLCCSLLVQLQVLRASKDPQQLLRNYFSSLGQCDEQTVDEVIEACNYTCLLCTPDFLYSIYRKVILI